MERPVKREIFIAFYFRQAGMNEMEILKISWYKWEEHILRVSGN
jgi:hypothetical protein